MTRVLVIDDEPAVTSVLKRGLTYEGFDVDVANNGLDGLSMMDKQPVDLLILDIMMPDMDGLEVLRHLRAKDSRLPVLFLTARDAEEDEILGLERGADDYIVKPFRFDVLLARIRALLRRYDNERSAHLSFADLQLDTGLRRAQRGDRYIDLTTTEYDLLAELMRYPGQAVARDHLMERVWGYDFGGKTNILDTYIKQLRQKLEEEGEPRLIHTLWGIGYVLREI